MPSEEPTDGAFAVSARRQANLSQSQAATNAGISERRLREAEKRNGPLDQEERECLARAYGVNDPARFILKKGLPSSLLLQAGGLCGEPSVEHEGHFQDFESDTFAVASRVNCPVAVLWADSRYRSFVQTNVCYAQSPQQSVLRIAFRNGAGPHPVSIGIHPQHMIARRLSRHQLGFRFRVLLLENAPPAQPLGVVVRVSDSAHRQWSYFTKRAVYQVFALDSPYGDPNVVIEDAEQDRWRILTSPPESAWTTIDIRTKEGSIDHQWSPFLHDEKKPDLDVITRITLEIGTRADTERPRGGQGVVLISPIDVIGAVVDKRDKR